MSANETAFITESDYQSFVAKKLAIVTRQGIAGDLSGYSLKPHQNDLTAWALRRGCAAIFADTGLGKSRMQIAWADVVRQQRAESKIIILAPLAVAEQTVEEAEKIGVSVNHCRDDSDVRTGVNITNYDRIHRFDCGQFDGVVLDECFAAGTMIDCESGRKRIQDIRKGDTILNASGVDSVADIHRREVPYGVKVKSQGQHFIASPNHPIFTQRGWVGAQDLCPGDYALATGAAMSLVRGDVHTKGPGAEGPAVLRDILLSEMADEHAGAQSEGAQAGDVCKDPCEAHGVAGVELPDSSEGVGTDTQLESHVGPDCQGENLPHIESHEAQSFRAWGQWDWADGAAGIHDGCAWRRLDSGICFVTGPTASELSDTLQDGLGESRAQNRHRTGWELALREKSTGREEGRQAGFIRLDGIEILEPGHPELERCRDAYGKLYFYDLGATRHPSFSVNGLLVHNSSIIKHHAAKTLQTLLDAFRATPFKLCATATPAPNDWTELGNHAEFLGVRSRAEMLAEFFVHDGGDTQTWRLKGHARHLFWRWVASWGAMVRSPADLGHDASEYELPPLHVHQHTVELDHNDAHGLFAMEAQTLSERRDARRASLVERVRECASVVYCDWYKTGSLHIQGESHGMEEGVRGNQEVESRSRPGVQGQEECSIDQQQRGEGAIHGRVLQEEPGEVQANPGTAGKVQRDPETEIQGVGRVSSGSKIGGEGLAGWESPKEEVSASEAVRADVARVQCLDGITVGSLRNLRPLGHVNAELLPCGGSLPLIGEGARASVHGLQYGTGKVQGRSGSTSLGGFIPQESWLIWCELNNEQDAMERAFGDLAFSVRGSDTADEKEALIRSWLARERPVMISKPSIMGFGLNFQHCWNMAFVGVTDSFEAYYQAVRRCYRFGQTKPVHVHVFASNLEGAVVANLKRKERDAQAMAEAMAAETIQAVKSEIFGFTKDTNIYLPKSAIAIPAFLERQAA